MDPKRNARGTPLQTSTANAAARGVRLHPAFARREAAPPSHAEALDRLEKDIRQLRIDFERFFGGGLPFPPEDLRTRIQGQLKTLRNVNMRSAVESFRLGDLEARFNSYNELYNRKIRDKEEGRVRGLAALAHDRPHFDPRRGVVIDGPVSEQAAEALFRELAKGPDPLRFDLGTFRTYLERQAEALRAKVGCTAVVFRLAEEEGKLKLKARPQTS